MQLQPRRLQDRLEFPRRSWFTSTRKGRPRIIVTFYSITPQLTPYRADKIEYLQSLPHPNSKTPLILSRRDSSRTVVAFLGDGINDSPALRKADVGISVGSGGDIAQQPASFILNTSNLNSLLRLISLSRAAVRRIMFNFAWACLFNLTAIPLAVGVTYTGKRI
jgi:Cu+-exporting ATPase